MKSKVKSKSVSNFKKRKSVNKPSKKSQEQIFYEIAKGKVKIDIDSCLMFYFIYVDQEGNLCAHNGMPNNLKIVKALGKVINFEIDKITGEE